MSDGGEIPVRVFTATDREALLMVRASGGRVVLNPPPPGPCALEPGSDVEDLKTAIEIASELARQQRGESPS